MTWQELSVSPYFEAGVEAPTGASVVLTYPVADVMAFVGVRDLGSSDTEAVRAAVAAANNVTVGNVEILAVTSTFGNAEGALVGGSSTSGRDRWIVLAMS
jgi:hypothetical protein